MNITDNRLLADTVNTSSLLGVGAAVVFFAAVVRNHQAVKFSGEVIGELAKVHWPSRDEALRATTTVVFATLFMAALIGVYDFVWKNVADVFLFTEG